MFYHDCATLKLLTITHSQKSALRAADVPTTVSW